MSVAIILIGRREASFAGLNMDIAWRMYPCYADYCADSRGYVCKKRLYKMWTD